jgi:quercetin dioxygenase-like cupin family protein
MKTINHLTLLSGFVPTGRTTRTLAITGIAAAALVMFWVRTVRATPPFNVVSATIVARASFLDPVDVKFKVNAGNEEVIHVIEAQDTVMQQIIIGPGGHTGWHSHPGPAVVLIKSGELTVYSADDPTCTGRTYLAGEAFIEHGQGLVQFAGNLSPTENVEVWVTYFDVPPGVSPRLDAADPGNCGP